MKGFLIGLLGLIGRIAGLAITGYYFYSYVRCEFFEKTEIHFFVKNNVFVLGSMIILGFCILFNSVDAFRKMFKVRFLKALIFIIFSALFGFMMWFIYTHTPY